MITPKPIHSEFPYAVSDLIDPVSRIWNDALITTHLWEMDRSRILKIHIGATTAKDRLVWPFSKNGDFSVASCYHMIFLESRSSRLPNVVEAGQGRAVSPINWNLIWKLNIPPKVRIFLWRVVLDILPHRAEQFRRKIVPSPYCERCQRSEDVVAYFSDLSRHGIYLVSPPLLAGYW